MTNLITVTSTAWVTPTPVEELDPIDRSHLRGTPPEPFTDWEGLAARRAADPTWAEDVAFANWIVYGKETP
ncbi:MAG: hypothetical protein ACOYOQ_00380 [Microthrixaceae bacterium]